MDHPPAGHQSCLLAREEPDIVTHDFAGDNSRGGWRARTKSNQAQQTGSNRVTANFVERPFYEVG
jgi:hypothetical protein